MTPLKTMVRIGDLFIGQPPYTPQALHGYYVSWLRLWAITFGVGATMAYFGWQKKDRTLMFWGLGEAVFGGYKTLQVSDQLRKHFAQQTGGA